jgi:glycosyltransferase involved in cell wall biosynthesis
MIVKVYYWSPHISDEIATVKAVKNSAISLMRYSKKYDVRIINAVGEWKNQIENLINNKVQSISFNNDIYTKLPRYSYLKSRISYFIIFLKSFMPLYKVLKKDCPDFLIAHLITSLPILMFIFFKFRTRLILRISGFPKMNFVRKLLWKFVNNKIYAVTCPTKGTLELLVNNNIFSKEKIYLVEDPIINIKDYIIKKKQPIEKNENFYKNSILLIGRLTKQKNFSLFIKSFPFLIKKYPDLRANIIGNGEKKEELARMIKKLNLDKYISLLDYKNNIFKYLINSKYFILTSLWEDPGFVLIEAAISNISIISSDCPNGPKDFLGNGKGGFLFKNNSVEDLVLIFSKCIDSENLILNKKKLHAKKNVKNYTLLRHFIRLDYLLNKNDY